ncbi:arabinose transporter [Sphingomonas tabacisoli]|uniref:Arabinose transporter n=1 Tax=Sphingomonas tabacisoli TaxID=2249466 RepID=A0ABW4I8P8_9SPHN
MSAAARERSESGAALILRLMPIAAAVFVCFFIIGMAMPVLPVYVHDCLGMGTFIVGLIAGSQFTASLISRFWAGRFADARGAKRAMVIGLVTAAFSGLIYLVSLRIAGAVTWSTVVLLLGRGVLGAAESFVITGALSWGLAIGGPDNSGTVMAWLGMPMYAAFAAGAPAGSSLYATNGFGAIAWATVLAPLVALMAIGARRGVRPARATPPSLKSVAGAVVAPGMGLALSSIGFGAITIFTALMFNQRGWSGAWIAVSALSIAFILARVLFGHLPDRLGGTRVAVMSAVIEAVGLILIWAASSPSLVFAGAALTGLGYSLVYPAFGVEAVRRAPPQSGGLVMGAYTACLDLGLGIGGPLLGLVAARWSLSATFLASSIIVLGAIFVAMQLMARNRMQRGMTA